MKECIGTCENFLEEFKANGFLLDDVAHHPINKIEDKKERNKYQWKGVPTLAKRMAGYRPKAVVALMGAIEEMVADAMRRAGLFEVPLYAAPFPRPENQVRFRAKMAEIIPKPPVAKGNN